VVWGDGTIDALAGTATSDSHAYSSTGSTPTASFTVYVNATDNFGLTGKSSIATKTISDRAPTVSFSESLTTANTGQTITLTITSADPDGTVSSLKVSWGDGTVDTLGGTATSDSHAYANTGNAKSQLFTVYVNATDNSGSTAKSTAASKTINDRPPTVSFTENTTSGTTATVITLTITAADPDGTVASLKVSWGDGTVDTLAGTATSDSHTYTAQNTYTVYTNATDNSGQTTKSATASKVISTNPIVVSFTENTTTATTGQTITLTISASEAGGTIASLKVVWGDGTIDTLAGTATTDSHSYASTGNSQTQTFVVYVNATDSTGKTQKSNTANKVISDRASTVGFTESATNVPTGTTITLTITAADPDGTVSSLKVLWGDGTVDTLTGSTTSDSHPYSSPGTFTVYVNATDNSGSTTKSPAATKTITQAANIPPTASFTESATNAPTGTSISFDASASNDPDGSIASYAWDFGDGMTGSGVTVSHPYAKTGNAMSMMFTVTLTVTDNGGATGTTFSIKTITDRPPVASFTFAPSSPLAGQTVSFDASASADPDGTIVGYAWGFGDSTSGSGITTNHVYSTTGSFTVTLAVTDNSGNIGTAQSTITVTTQQAGAHASLFAWGVRPQWKKFSVSRQGPIEPIQAFGANDGNRTIWAYVQFKIASDAGVSAILNTQVVQLAPGQQINGNQDPRFSASFRPAVPGTYSVQATIYYSTASTMPLVGDPSFTANLSGQRTVSFEVRS
jgi:PKD repeat protein